MIADRLLARLRGRLGYEPSAWSLVRILVVAVLALVLVSQVLGYRQGELVSPWNKVRGTNHSHIVSLTLGDTRGYRPAASPDSYRIAWVGGSEILGVKPGHQALVPGLVNNRIKTVDGRHTNTDVYFQNAMRLGDELSSLHRALASKPDLVVVSLNPVWVLNDLAVQQWGYLDGLLARGSAWPPSSWPVAASLVSPGDVGWKGLSSAFGAIDDRLYWGADLADRTKDLSFLDTVPNGHEPPLSGLGVLGLTRPVDFWQSKYGGVSPTASVDVKQLAVLERGVDSKSGINRQVLRDMFEAVRRAHVKAYFYVPAIKPELYDKQVGHDAIAKLRVQLAEATKGETTSRVLFDPQGLQDRVAPTTYKDIVHKLNPAPEVQVLTGDLCDLIAKGGHQTGCETP